jgi:hypothetical protein
MTQALARAKKLRYQRRGAQRCGIAGTIMVSMGTVWDRATEFLSDNLAAIFPLALLTIFLPAAISQSIAPLGALGVTAAFEVQAVSLVFTLVSLWGKIAIMALALDATAGRANAIATANGRLLPIVGITLIIGAGVVALTLPIVVALVMAGFDFQAAMTGGKPEIPPGVAGFSFLYLLFLCCALIWFSARLALVTPTMIMERRGFGVFARSFKLTRRIQWKIIGVLILYSIVVLVSYLAAKLVFGSIFGLIAGGDGPVTVASVLTAILASVVLTAFNVLAAAFTAKLYLAVRDAREAIVESA